MTKVILEGISQKGKNRVRENGSVWVVHARTERVLFNPEKGPWLFVFPEGKNHTDNSSRWIKEVGDVNFRIVGQIPQ